MIHLKNLHIANISHSDTSKLCRKICKLPCVDGLLQYWWFAHVRILDRHVWVCARLGSYHALLNAAFFRLFPHKHCSNCAISTLDNLGLAERVASQALPPHRHDRCPLVLDTVYIQWNLVLYPSVLEVAEWHWSGTAPGCW